jgi:hypothetical protein
MEILLVWHLGDLVGVIPNTKEDQEVLKSEIPNCEFQTIELGDYDPDGLYEGKEDHGFGETPRWHEDFELESRRHLYRMEQWEQ